MTYLIVRWKKRVSKQVRYLDISGFVNNADLNNKMKKLATKEELKAE